MPALIFLVPFGPRYFNYLQITMLTLAGGILGVLMMVPLRRALIVKEHGVLPYPEGTACAEVLVAGERGGKLAALVFSGLGDRRAVEVAVVDLQPLPHRTSATSCRGPASFPNATLARRHLARVPRRRLRDRPAHRRDDGRRRRAGVAGTAAAADDPRRSTSPVPFPPIHPNFALNPATGRPFLISEMDPGQLWSAYIRYIGAGGVLAAGLITLAATLPTIVSSARGSLKGFAGTGSGTAARGSAPNATSR